MAETTEQYVARVMGYLGARDPLRVMARTPRRLERIVSGVSPRLARQRPAPDKWSIREIVCHLADAELALAWRLRNMLATPGVRLQWWDENVWPDACGYDRTPMVQALDVFRVLRASNLALVKAVGTRRWSSAYGLHDTRGRQTVTDFIRMEAAHDLNHLARIAAILARSSR